MLLSVNGNQQGIDFLPLLLEDAQRPGDFFRRDAFSDFLHALHDLLEAKTFRSADPLQTQPLGMQAEFLHLLPDSLDTPLRPVVGVDVVAVADMAAGNQDYRSPPFEGTPDELFVHPGRAHGADHARIWRVAEP